MLALYQPQRTMSRVFWGILRRVPPGVAIPKHLKNANSPSDRLRHFDWQKWVERIAGDIGATGLYPAFYFPPDFQRFQCAAMLLDRDGRQGVFAKLSWGENAKARLAREYRGLEFAAGHLKSVSTPRALALGEQDSTHYLLCSLMPPETEAPPVRWGWPYVDFCNELQSGFGTQRRLESMHWWQPDQMSSASRAAAVFLEKNEPPDGYRLNPSHGDLAPWNARVQDGNPILFDWEWFEPLAPRLVDPYHFALTNAVLIQKYRDASDLQQAVRKILQTIPHAPEELLLAQVYLALILPANIVRDLIEIQIAAAMSGEG